MQEILKFFLFQGGYMSYKTHDVFHSFLVESATYDGIYEMPVLASTQTIPRKAIPFSKALSSKDSNQWVCFYEHDYCFARIWNNPKQYLSVLKRFQGVISPDFSLYRNMPLPMQIWNTYRGKALAYWWQQNGITVIPNIRFSDKRSFDFCFSGVPRNSVVSIGTVGTLKNKLDKAYLQHGLSKMVKVLNPSAIVVYGSAPDELFSTYQKQGIHIVQLDSDTALHFKKAVI